MMEQLGTIFQAHNTTRVAKANYRSQVAATKAGNDIAKAKGDLANWSRSLSNRRMMTAAGKQYSRAMEQVANLAASSVKEDMNLGLSNAEQIGVMQARAAYSGVGGASVDAMENMIALQAATTQQELDDAIAMALHYGKEDASTSYGNSLKSQDFSQQVMNFSYQEFIEPKKMKYRLGKLIGVAAATWFGGPMMGEAAANAAVGDWQASNGNFTGAAQSFGNAAGGALSAWQGWNERGGVAWGSDLTSGFRATGGDSAVSARAASSSAVSMYKGNTKVSKSSAKGFKFFGGG